MKLFLYLLAAGFLILAGSCSSLSTTIGRVAGTPDKLKWSTHKMEAEVGQADVEMVNSANYLYPALLKIGAGTFNYNSITLISEGNGRHEWVFPEDTAAQVVAAIDKFNLWDEQIKISKLDVKVSEITDFPGFGRFIPPGGSSMPFGSLYIFNLERVSGHNYLSITLAGTVNPSLTRTLYFTPDQARSLRGFFDGSKVDQYKVRLEEAYQIRESEDQAAIAAAKARKEAAAALTSAKAAPAASGS